MKVKCPHCGTVQTAPDEATGREALCKSCRQAFTLTLCSGPVEVAVADESRAKLINWTAILVAAICTGGLGWAFGFACGGVLTRPSREKVEAEIRRYQDIAAEHVRARNVAKGRARGNRDGLTSVDPAILAAAVELYEVVVRAEALQDVLGAIQRKFGEDGYGDTFLCTLDGHREQLARVLAKAEAMRVPDNDDVRRVHVDVVEGLTAQMKLAEFLNELYRSQGSDKLLAKGGREAAKARQVGTKAQIMVISLWEAYFPGVMGGMYGEKK